MRYDQQIPEWVELWAVANPMTETTIKKVKYKVCRWTLRKKRNPSCRAEVMQTLLAMVVALV